MRNILLTVSYDGTDFCGWQRQDEGSKRNVMRTVQGELEEALLKLHKQEIVLYGSGRTDSGVHAVGQKANFFSPIDSIPINRYMRAINTFLPQDIRVTKVEEVDEGFNARFSATSRMYRYFIHTGEVISASQTRFCWNTYYQENIHNLNAMASLLKGEMDCASFAASGDESLSTNRYIDGARFFYEPMYPDGRKALVFEIEANAFLWKMVRTITGTLIGLDKAGKGPEDFRKIIESHDRRCSLATAPSHGLFLYDIKFDGVRRHP